MSPYIEGDLYIKRKATHICSLLMLLKSYCSWINNNYGVKAKISFTGNILFNEFTSVSLTFVMHRINTLLIRFNVKWKYFFGLVKGRCRLVSNTATSKPTKPYIWKGIWLIFWMFPSAQYISVLVIPDFSSRATVRVTFVEVNPISICCLLCVVPFNLMSAHVNPRWWTWFNIKLVGMVIVSLL